MKLSTKGQYAVMALADMVRHGKNKPVPLNEIAVRQNLPVQYLEQLFSKLRRKGIVTSVRGNMGGYALSHDPETIRILDIIQAVDEKIRTKRCSASSLVGCHGKPERCLTHHLWDGLEGHIAAYLNSVNLADLCKEASSAFERAQQCA